MSITKINKRKRDLNNRERHINKSINFRILSENCKKGDISSLETVIINWESLNNDKNMAFTNLLEFVDVFINENTKDMDKNRICNLLEYNVLPKITDIDMVYNRLEKYNIFNDNILEKFKEFDCYNRIIKNQNQLEDIINIKESLNNFNLNSNIGKTLFIGEIVNKTKDLNIDNDVIYTMLTENIYYTLENNNVRCDKNFIAESVSLFLSFNNIKPVNDVNTILENSYIYKDILIFESQKYDSNLRKDFNKLKKSLNITTDNVLDFIESLKLYTVDSLVEFMNTFLEFLTNFSINSIYKKDEKNIFTILCEKIISELFSYVDCKSFINKLNKIKIELEKTLNKVKDVDIKQGIKFYIKDIENATNILIDKLSIKDFDINIYKDILKESNDIFYIGLSEYYKNHHNKVNIVYQQCIREIKRLVDSKYKNIKDIIYIQTRSQEYFSKLNNDKVYNYIIENKLVLPLVESMSKDILDIVDILNNKLNEDYFIYTESQTNMFRIYLVYKTPIIYDVSIHLDKLKDLDYISYVSYYTSKINESVNKLKDILENNIQSLDYKELNKLTDIVSKYDIINNENILEIYKNYKKSLYNSCETQRNIKIDILNKGIYKLCECKYTIYDNDRYKCLDYVSEIANNLESFEVLNELNIVTKAKVAKENLSRKINQLSDKEKVLSRKLDDYLDNFGDRLQKELSSKNRESVIKGRVLPSMSSMIKIALVSGGMWIVSPILSVVSIVGSIAVNKSSTKRERQMILDEIDIQLKLIEKKIQLAEQNSDMKALEQLLKLEQGLKKERQRILYKLKNTYPITSYNKNNN